MSNQTVDQQRELRRFEDRKGNEPHNPMPWYLTPGAANAVVSLLLYVAIAIGVPVLLNLVFNWISKVRIFL